MHVLLTNDDGPLDDQSCPYMKYFVDEIRRTTDWKISIVIPHQQRSWIGKAHFAGKTLSTSFIYTKDSTSVPGSEINKFEGPFTTSQQDLLNQDYLEWCLVDSTPAACADIGIHYNSHSEPVDLVISGPNFGKNSGNLYILTSGTVGAAMEAATHGVKSIALSFEFRSLDHDFATLKEASKISVALVKRLYRALQDLEKVDLFSVNVPLIPSLSYGKTKIHYAPILKNQWASIYEKIDDGKYAWAPDFQQVWKDGAADFSHSDSRVLLNEGISVTPLQAAFKSVEPFEGEILLDGHESSDSCKSRFVFLITIPSLEYIFGPLTSAFKTLGCEILTDISILKQLGKAEDLKVFHYGDYEDLDIDLISHMPDKYYVCSYIYRKALIRKHYLANTVRHFVAKNPISILTQAFPETYQIEVDYAEFLDDALDDAYELRDEIESGQKTWILKPSMSDKGQGIRVFNTVEQLQMIFDSFEEGVDSDEEASDLENGIIISQLRHFVVQEYQCSPLLLPAYQNRKFHLRTYVVCVGSLKVHVYEKILALFAGSPYVSPQDQTSDDEIIELAGHLTNTCLQEGNEPLVKEFWDLKGLAPEHKCDIFDAVCSVLSDLFAAATSVDKINFQPLPNAIEFYGIDFLVNSDMSVKLLEVNAYPDFKQTGPDLKALIDELFESSARDLVAPLLQIPGASFSEASPLVGV